MFYIEIVYILFLLVFHFCLLVSSSDPYVLARNHLYIKLAKDLYTLQH
jgi:hypothetical protein